jgi:cobalamin biosynthesis protein CobT
MNEATFNQRLNSVMKDNMFDRYVSNKRSGKLDPRKTFKIGYRDRIFKKKEERMNKNYSVSILVDCSGSMTDYNKHRYAAVATATLASAFRQIPTIDFEIVGFNQWDTIMKGFGRPAPSLKWLRSKVISLASDLAGGGLSEEENERDCYYRYAVHKQNGGIMVVPNRDKKKFETDPMYSEWKWHPSGNSWGAGENFDGYIVHNMRLRLRERMGKKICIMLSDGQPTPRDRYTFEYPNKKASDFKLQDEVNKAINEDGITFISIGILDDFVKSIYPKDTVAVINNVEEIYPVIIDKFSKLIKRG